VAIVDIANVPNPHLSTTYSDGRRGVTETTEHDFH